MATFLFWNLARKRLEARVARLVAEYRVDILLLAECSIAEPELTSAIDAAGGGAFLRHDVGRTKVELFYRRTACAFSLRYADVLGRLTVFGLSRDGLAEILLAAVHLPSRRDRSHGDNAQSATYYASRLREIERALGNDRTVVVGDLNMNPFEHGVVSGHGFHGVMTQAKALEIERSVDGENSPFFYNPMWGCFGDRTPGPPGTFFRSASEPINYFWNIYDQVLIRPALL